MPDGQIQKYQSVKMMYFNHICILKKIREEKKPGTKWD